MKRSKLSLSIEDSFSFGKIAGQREAFEEILEMTKVNSVEHIRIYLQARLKTLGSINNDPFKTKGDR